MEYVKVKSSENMKITLGMEVDLAFEAGKGVVVTRDQSAMLNRTCPGMFTEMALSKKDRAAIEAEEEIEEDAEEDPVFPESDESSNSDESGTTGDEDSTEDTSEA